MTNVLTPPPVASRTPSNDDTVDGRTLRRSRNRDAVVSALISLIQEGDLDPTVASIADRAAVSHRSIFRYFPDLDTLARTALATAVRSALPLAVIDDVGEGSLEHRIEQMIASRMRILSHTKSLIQVAKAKSTAIPEVNRGLSDVATMSREQFRRHFATELNEMEPLDRAHVTALLSTQMSFEGYAHQSEMLNRNDEEIADAWRVLMRRLLA